MTNNNPVIVTANEKGACLEIVVDDHNKLSIIGERKEELFRIIVKQGDRYASLMGDMELMACNLDVVPGQEIPGRIVIEEQFEPFIPDDPLCLIKTKNGKICRKDGKVIYSRSYLTYKLSDVDQIIEED